MYHLLEVSYIRFLHHLNVVAWMYEDIKSQYDSIWKPKALWKSIWLDN